MNARDELAGLYEQWRRWTEAEGEAIRNGAWSQVTQCQEAKLQLQPQIARAAEQVQREAAPSTKPDDLTELPFRDFVNELIELEHRNLELLASQRQRAGREKDSLDRASRNLRQVHRSYAPDRGGSGHWQSYS